MLAAISGDNGYPSPSSRAEWVEMFIDKPVGRGRYLSPSSRAEWVEISRIDDTWLFNPVSVLAGGVG